MFALFLLIACAIHANAHERNGRVVKDYGAEVHKVGLERRIFNLKRNGVNIDVKVVPSVKDESGDSKDDDENDYFPEFPVKDIGRCIIEFSLGCIRKRFVRFLETVGRLDEITLLGQDVKLVRSRIARSDGRAARNDSDVSIERSVDDLFDSFTLRITLPRWNSKREKNQIDVMLDDTAVAEGRGKKGGGGGKGKGGKCKMMMMGMLMMVKMKLMGLAAMKGIMMGGMSLMLSMMMLSQKFGKGGGPWQSGGGGGGGQLKEIVLLTKSSGGGSGGGGGCCGGGLSDSYSAPPPSSYGTPSGGGGGGGYNGGGGWGRSFHRQSMTLSHDKVIKTENGPDRAPMMGEVIANAENIDYPDYQDYQEVPTIAMSNSTVFNWSKMNDIAFQEHKAIDLNLGKNNNSKIESTVIATGRSLVLSGDLPANVVGVIRKDPVSSELDVNRDKNMLHPIYADEWQATAEKTTSDNAAPLNSNVRFESPRDPRVKDIPLLRGI
ncbi:uncharacterized protein LOC116840580 [Odontomachus brunneus]|uniref:uncharacterized protein LOC116840580 n=1 Tax=Odontomachus brunneus TaxID=486640 RepID=UPI0013F19EF4|nr:uncharacterized protein LOC116840580 [Odontomachus brunneus]